MTNPTITDAILLRLGPDQSAGQKLFQWHGAWPPPQYLDLIRELATDQYKLVQPEAQNPGDIDYFQHSPDYEVIRFALARASNQEEPAPPGAGWFRAAEYLPRRKTT